MNQEEYLRFQLEFHKWTPEDLAKFARVRHKDVEAILKGQKLRDTDSRSKLSRCLGINTEVWNHL